jgi:hypothetical protein
MQHQKSQAVEIIPNKLWITYDLTGNKTGTMRRSGDDEFMLQYLVDGSCIAHDSDNLSELFDFVQRTDMSDTVLETQVFGYPIPDRQVFNKQQKGGIPVFTKTAKSTVLFAAGHYGINFVNGGWLHSYSPKFSTLNKYDFLGPFKTQSDAQLAIKAKQRNTKNNLQT